MSARIRAWVVLGLCVVACGAGGAFAATAANPTAAASASPSLAKTGEKVWFSASGSKAPGSRIVSWKWDFGDGSTANASPTAGTTSHAYARAGTFKAVLTIGCSNGRKAYASVTVKVEKNPVLRASGTSLTLTRASCEKLVRDLASGKYSIFSLTGIASLLKAADRAGWINLSKIDCPVLRWLLRR